MSVVIFNLAKHESQQIAWRSTIAFSMVSWLRNRGLEPRQDYTWHLDTEKNTLTFTFNDETESWASMFGLYWSEYL